MVELKGIAWGHTRAIAPLLVTAEIRADLYPDVRIAWEKRSLWAFGEAPLADLAERYDLLVIDHPMIGFAARHELILPLDMHLTTEWLAEQALLSVGASHESYGYDGHQWAIALDAACQVSAWRPDLLARVGVARPATWGEVVVLARSTRRVAIPLTVIDAFCSFITLCANQGEPPLRVGSGYAVDRELGLRVLDQLRELASLVDPACFDMNPIDVLNRMSTGAEILGCPLTFGYTNYSREGYAPHRLAFCDIPAAGEHGSAGATLGGAGLAISSRCAHVGAALEYLRWVTGPECQRSTYVAAGGQPSHAAAWDDDLANRLTGDFFRNTRRTIEAAYLRPTRDGMEAFQTRAGERVRAVLRGEATATAALDQMDELFRAHLPGSED